MACIHRYHAKIQTAFSITCLPELAIYGSMLLPLPIMPAAPSRKSVASDPDTTRDTTINGPKTQRWILENSECVEFNLHRMARLGMELAVHPYCRFGSSRREVSFWQRWRGRGESCWMAEEWVTSGFAPHGPPSRAHRIPCPAGEILEIRLVAVSGA